MKNTFNFKTKVMIASTVLAASSAFATPTLYPAKALIPLSVVKNDTNSNVVSDDLEATKFWVMPPNTGTSTVTQLVNPTANMAFCGEMSDDARFSASLNSRINDLEEESIASKKEVDKIRAQLDAVRVEATQYAQDKHMQDLTDLDQAMLVNQTRLDGLYQNSNACSKDCDHLNDEIKALVSANRDLLKTRQKLVAQHAADLPLYAKYQAKIKALQANLDDERKSWEDLQDSVAKVRNQFNMRFAELGKMQGGFASIAYKSGWDQNVSDLRTANPRFAFEKIPTETANIFTSLASIANVPGANAIMAYQVPGAGKDGTLNFPSYPDSFSGVAVLSLIGACPLIHPEKFDLPANTASLKYGVISTYNFPSTFNVKVKVTYNMHKMYQKIVSSGSHGGFFSSHSYSSVTERTDYKDAFTVDWTSNDASVNLTDEQKIKMEDEMKLDVYTRMARLALHTSPDLNGIIAAAKAPAEGALVISSTLMIACPGNIYCIAGSAVFQVLDAIFGSASTTSSYTQYQDADLTEEWSNSKVVLKPWITSYQ